MNKKSEGVIKWRRRTKQKMIEALGGKCKVCGYNKCQEAMDFHHVNPENKEFEFGKVRSSPKALPKLIEELKKCALLCSRCHREVHAGMLIVDEPSQLDENKLIGEIELRRQIKRQSALVMTKIDRRKILLSKDELVNLLEAYGNNKSALARYLNVSEAAIRKRLK